MKKERILSGCRIIDLPCITSERKGNITPIYSHEHVPFSISRVYYLYDIPAGSDRGGHAHKKLEQLIVSASGSFNVEVDDGQTKSTINLNRPFYGLYIPRLIWRRLDNFSAGAICLVLASLPYSEDDYIRSHQEFLRFIEDNAYSIS